jgi:hypothetical protein
LTFYDFECPSAKHLIGSLSNDGLGKNLRTEATALLLAGLLTNRVVHFVNSKYEWRLLEKWRLGDCPTHDFRCFHLPPTPCVLTRSDLRHASRLSVDEQFSLFESGSLPDPEAKVVVVTLSLPLGSSAKVKVIKALSDYTDELLSRVSKDDHRYPAMTAGKDVTGDMPKVGFRYAGDTSRLHHAMTIFAARLRPSITTQLGYIFAATVQKSFNSSCALGVPIEMGDYNCVMKEQCFT